jgi:hypothetical protein
MHAWQHNTASCTAFTPLLWLPLPQVGYDSSAHIAEETKNAAMAGIVLATRPLSSYCAQCLVPLALPGGST